MTTPPDRPRDETSGRLYWRRFVYASVAIVILLLVLLGVGLKASLDARRQLCPPSNPNCSPLPPTAPPATVPR
jgi:hypothetical protein